MATAKATAKKSTKAKGAKKSAVPAKNVASSKVEQKSVIRKRPSKKTILFFAAVIILAILIYVFRGFFVAATVNGEIIPRFALNQEIEKQVGEKTLNDLITKKLILQEMKNRNIAVSQEEVDAEIKKIETALKEQQRTLDEALMAQGITREELNEQLKIQKMIEKLFKDNVKVSDKEVADYITQNADVLPTDQEPEVLEKTVREQLKQQALTEKFQAWLQELQAKATINRFVQF